MLVSLSIRDVVLIEKLDLPFAGGLSVFTGETGAGKSILLDSLSLVLGARADSGLVRRGAPQLSVTAEFDPPLDHPARHVLAEQDMDVDGAPLVLRRVVTADGRSRAYINDQAASVGLLRKIGDELVEIHGQFDSHGMLDSQTHLPVLDAFANTGPMLAATRAAWGKWREAAKIRAEAEQSLATARAEEDLLRHSCDELQALNPKSGEEAELAQTRTLLQHGEKLVEAMNSAMGALVQRGDVEGNLRTARRTLERVAERADGRLEPVIAALDRAADEAADAIGQLERVSADIDLDPRHLEKVEERLFALRGAARKYGTEVDGLADLRDRLARQLAALDGGGDDLARLARAEDAARQDYVREARALSAARTQAAARLDQSVAAELPPLKLDKARFTTLVEPLAENAWGAAGLDRVEFQVATNPGAAPGPLGKIASGGELSRFMLALKVVLAQTGSVPTMVFDEVDAGIGGAVAAAVGDRLARLGGDVQVLVVTHSPQVAARGGQHYHVAKHEAQPGQVVTGVEQLPQESRCEEIARMLAGETVTDEARAAARSLLNG